MNLLTDVAPAIAIAVRPPVDRRPEDLLAEGPDASLGASLERTILARAIATAAGASAAWAGGRMTGRPERAKTVALVGLVGSQLGQTLIAGGRRPSVLAASVGSAALMAGIVQTPGISHLFGCTPLGPVGWTIGVGTAAGATALSLAIPAVRDRWAPLQPPTNVIQEHDDGAVTDLAAEREQRMELRPV